MMPEHLHVGARIAQRWTATGAAPVMASEDCAAAGTAELVMASAIADTFIIVRLSTRHHPLWALGNRCSALGAQADAMQL